MHFFLALYYLLCKLIRYNLSFFISSLKSFYPQNQIFFPLRKNLCLSFLGFIPMMWVSGTETQHVSRDASPILYPLNLGQKGEVYYGYHPQKRHGLMDVRDV